MIMPGRIWVAGIDIAKNNLLKNKCGLLSRRRACPEQAKRAEGRAAIFSAAPFPPHKGRKLILHSGQKKGNLPKAAFIVTGLHSLPLGKLATTLAED
jgi:hypothetical protein